jgi:uncharacterized membrane protein
MTGPIRFTTLALLALLASCTGRDSEGANEPALAEPVVANLPAENSVAPPASEAPPEPDSPEPATAAISPCLVQDGRRVGDNRIRAIGTEPFWGARIEGRCVTYSTPEDQDGTRIWTQFTGTVENGAWTGYLDNDRFILRTRPQPGCSDGMSDNRYPIAVSLTVRGEERTGCAEPL